MLIQDHLAKARRYSDASKRLPLNEHAIGWAWAHMHAATQLVNAVLHARALTLEEDAYPTMKHGVFVWRDAGSEFCGPRRLGDIIHSDNDALPADLAGEIVTDLRTIEVEASTLARGRVGDVSASLNMIRDCYERVRACAAEEAGEFN